MTPTEVISEIQKLPLSDVRQVTDQLTRYLHEQETVATHVNMDVCEDEFESYLLAKGLVSHIATQDETGDEFDAFDPIVVKGEPLSETIIRERR